MRALAQLGEKPGISARLRSAGTEPHSVSLVSAMIPCNEDQARHIEKSEELSHFPSTWSRTREYPPSRMALYVRSIIAPPPSLVMLICRLRG